MRPHSSALCYFSFVIFMVCSACSEPAPPKQPSSTPTIASKPELIFDGMKIDYPTWALATDPTLGKIDGQWWIFFNSINGRDGYRIHILGASLPKGMGLGAPASAWQIYRKDGAIAPIISPRENHWDKQAAETADYVRGYDAAAKKWVERLYFVGWPNPTAKLVDYRIGFVERQPDGSWLRHPEPVFVAQADWERLSPDGSFVGDEAVIYEPGPAGKEHLGIWHMWYQCGGPEGVSLGHATSKDGVHWENRKRLPHKVAFVAQGKNTGPFHLDVAKYRGRYVFVGWVSDPELVQQGHWLVSSSTPDGSAPGDFTDWKPLLYELGGEPWYFAGEEGSRCHATGLFSATLAEDGDKLWVYFGGTGVREGSRSDPCKDAGSHMAHIGRIEVTVPAWK